MKIAARFSFYNSFCGIQYKPARLNTERTFTSVAVSQRFKIAFR